MDKPIIGIISKHYNGSGVRRSTHISDEIKNAILDNGGIPIGIIPTNKGVNYLFADFWKNCLSQEEQENILAQINLCDGLIIQGGARSDIYEVYIARYAFDHDIPTLGICQGQNTMIRAMGGTTKNVENLSKHGQTWADYAHPIRVMKDSKFYQIVKCERFKVNSRHKTTIDNPSSKYYVSGISDDGSYEVLEAPNKRFNFAIRFHPETLYAKDKKHNRIFSAFVNACKEYKEEKNNPTTEE
ncbi:MAG: gamma-glutamyl-gamma-aminobutyrate hydrolase family protein [Clostridia bacterium]|nr:gamma-glutamyl-gamma-aminobutyrate hydrolase family protein [Clostridia bacterium]